MAALTSDERDKLQHASDSMTKSTAVELPPHVDVWDEVARVAESSGFKESKGAFLEAAKDKPLSTLLDFLVFVGTP